MINEILQRTLGKPTAVKRKRFAQIVTISLLLAIASIPVLITFQMWILAVNSGILATVFAGTLFFILRWKQINGGW